MARTRCSSGRTIRRTMSICRLRCRSSAVTEIGATRVSAPPYNSPLDTTTLPNGPHTLQLWAHDTSNNVDLSPTVPVISRDGDWGYESERATVQLPVGYDHTPEWPAHAAALGARYVEQCRSVAYGAGHQP